MLTQLPVRLPAKVVMDRVSDRPKGFGFVTFASQEEADKAVTKMNGKVKKKKKKSIFDRFSYLVCLIE